jgi:hypothetical protein
MDGADTSDPEMGGATFSNFNVDAVEEIQSSSGWMPAEIGRGAAGFTNILTRSGSSGFHGSVFEFVRNSSPSTRATTSTTPPRRSGRIPPFRRNEFGFTNGGPVVIPHIYNGRGKTFYFGQYQGFRQVLGTTQVFPSPQQRSERTAASIPSPTSSRRLDVTDTLYVPVDPAIAPSSPAIRCPTAHRPYRRQHLRHLIQGRHQRQPVLLPHRSRITLERSSSSPASTSIT